MANLVCDIDSKSFINTLLLVAGNGASSQYCRRTFTPYAMSIYFRLLKEYLVSKQILKGSEAKVTENCDRPTQTPYCGFVFLSTCYKLLDACSARAV